MLFSVMFIKIKRDIFFQIQRNKEKYKKFVKRTYESILNNKLQIIQNGAIKNLCKLNRLDNSIEIKNQIVTTNEMHPIYILTKQYI